MKYAGIATNEGGPGEKLIVRVPVHADDALGLELEGDHYAIFNGDEEIVYHPWIYKQFSIEDCERLEVDFGGWLSS